jgi:endonuclease/exonuclease/phosphatase family metal-dependent hydrolase
MTAPRSRIRRCLLSLQILALFASGLFVFNGLVLAAQEDPILLIEGAAEPPPPPAAGTELRAVAYNIAKAFAHQGGFDFAERAAVEARLGRMAEVLAPLKPELVFLSEALWRCGPCPVDQPAFLAAKLGLPYRLLGENYNVGVPGFRIAGGNAILSRYPLRGVANFDLLGRKPFYVTTNNRRALFGALALADGSEVLLGAMHVDSHSRPNNAAQWKQIHEWIGARPTILAGDFNARPHEPGVVLLRESGRYVGAFDGPGTTLFRTPRERIDFVLAPASFEHVETRVLETDASDHLPVLGVFRVR